MKTGMLWFDNDPKTTLAAKVIRAVAYYAEKYGRVPNLCLVHPTALEAPPAAKAASPQMREEPPNFGGVVVRPYRPVLPGHLWIGIDPAMSQQSSAAPGGAKEKN